MTINTILNKELRGENALPMRPIEQVMNLERLGAAHQSRLSFMRTLIRRIMRERWQISATLQQLDNDGYGTVIYSITTAKRCYSFVIFSNYLSNEERNDRVIASKWDLTMALVDGDVDDTYLSMLRENVPKQEAGRVDSRVFVLSRANRSARNFEYVIDKLSNGAQPETEKIAKVGYLYRTTAVYGSGKLGMADWEKVASRYSDFASPFCAEMFVCLMLRNFSFTQVEHIAKHRNPDSYRPMQLDIKRFFGIGNSTGLGMAPFLINHPQLINRLIEMRELAFARVKVLADITPFAAQRFLQLVDRCHIHTVQTVTEDEWQTQNNKLLVDDLARLTEQFNQGITDWKQLIYFSEQHCSLQGQEILVSILLELYPELVDELENHLTVDESLDLDPLMSTADLKSLIEKRYAWALAYDFSLPEEKGTFWYRSQEKMEPRLGQTDAEPGKEKEMPLGIAYAVRQCYDSLSAYNGENPSSQISNFMIDQPKYRSIVRRIQSMSKCFYGDIQANLLSNDILPMHMLRSKLAFFGVGKFDPRSKLWVRNTMFQGAPLLEDIGKSFNDDWFMPLAPNSSDGGEK
jgi:hypothetical protein